MTVEQFRGELYCTICHQEGKSILKARAWNLVRQEDGSYISYCHKHQPESIYQNPNLSMVKTCLSFPWEDVAKITLHKLKKDYGTHKGKIITVEMREVPNIERMQRHSIQVCQALMLMADRRCAIHNYGERGEQNHCFVEPNYHWDTPAACVIRDKYWGDEQVKRFHDVCRLMARIHEWELVDETLNVLDRIVKAVDPAGPESSPL
jgi:hypothetical protein